MKRILTSLLMAVGITGPFVSHLAAQTNTEVADIPFAFVVSHTTMPAGKYLVSQFNGGSATFALSDRQGHKIFTQLGSNKQGNPDNPSLTFARYGNEYVLAKVTPPNSTLAYGLTQDAIERQLSHKMGMASMVAIKLTPR
jgi:hypothetical protein